MSCPTCRSPEPGTCLLNDSGPHPHGFRGDCCTAVFHASLHTITERADARPDLGDLVALILYLREHDIPHAVDGGSTKSFMVRTLPSGWRPHLVAMEGVPLDEARFVGPDGTVYDANREAL